MQFMIMESSSLSLIFFLFLSLIFEAVKRVELPQNMIILPSSSSLPKADYSSLSALELQGSISFDVLSQSAAAHDFGHLFHRLPAAVLSPSSAQDIIKVVLAAAQSFNLTVAARGNGHSINGQAQALDGVVIDMLSFADIHIHVDDEGFYADVGGGTLWIDLLKASLHQGLAPKSWTDYLYLTVGGTLQNAGVGGQTFKHGPQISNVLELDVVTGKGESITCSRDQNSDLFYGSLGGLGQFGIITRARIALEPAKAKVRWVRLVYDDINTFTQDQELLISAPEDNSFDYIEGFVLSNSNDPVNGWPQVPFTPNQKFDLKLVPKSAGPVLYCLEVTKNYNEEDYTNTMTQVSSLLAPLRYIKGLEFNTDVTYFDFLNRLYPVEVKLRELGLWQEPHPWLCLFVPRSRLREFDEAVFKRKLSKGVGGPMLLYPMNKGKWDDRFSAVVPAEEVFYLVALLRSGVSEGVEGVIAENEEIVRTAGTHVKQYMPRFTTPSDWIRHFGPESWLHFRSLKALYDPLAILSPGQGIFRRNHPL